MFRKNRELLLNQDSAQRFSGKVKAQGLTSVEHFTVDGTLSKRAPDTTAFSGRIAMGSLKAVRETGRVKTSW